MLDESMAPGRPGDVTQQWPEYERGATAAELAAGVYEVLINDKRHKMLFVASRSVPCHLDCCCIHSHT